MTTGRINQITIFKPCSSTASPEGDCRERSKAKLVRFGKELYDPLGGLRKQSSSVARGLVLSWFATNWDISLKAQMRDLKCSLRAMSLVEHLLPPRRDV